jgi:acetyl-CoA C-acetyltransferase
LTHAGFGPQDVEYYEINEAFSVVALANMRLLKLDPSRVNVFGGGVSIGHPLGRHALSVILTV